MRSDPRVTVLLPVYNAEPYVGDAIRSILNQTFTDFELLIVDDASTDDTPRTIETHANDRRVRVITNPRNLGLIASLNLGIRDAKGAYIARMDGDDVSAPRRLERQMAYLFSHPDVVALGTAAQVIDAHDRRERRTFFPETDVLLRWSLCYYSPIVHPSAVFSKAAVLESGGYDARFIHAEDYDLLVRLSQLGQLANLREVLLYVRHYARTVARPEYEDNAARISQRVLSKYLGEGAVDLDTARLLSGARHVNTPGARRSVIALVTGLRTAFEETESLTPPQRKRIAAETAFRLLSMSLGRGYWRGADRLAMCREAVRHDLVVPLRALSRAVRSYAVIPGTVRP